MGVFYDISFVSFIAKYLYSRVQNSCVTKNKNAKLLGLFFLEPVPHRCSVKKVFLKILQNFTKKASARVSIILKKKPPSLQLYWERDSSTGVLLPILWHINNSCLQNIWKQLVLLLLLKQCVCSFSFHININLKETIEKDKFLFAMK